MNPPVVLCFLSRTIVMRKTIMIVMIMMMMMRRRIIMLMVMMMMIRRPDEIRYSWSGEKSTFAYNQL